MTDGTSTWIVRRPPLGHVQATAHDMGREYTAMSALADTDVPVPRMFAHCADETCSAHRSTSWRRSTASRSEPRGSSTAAAPSGPTRSPAGSSTSSPPSTPSTPTQVGLSEFGRPHGFLERQVRRWGKQLEGSKTREHPDADELHRLLTERLPAEDPSVLGVVHGDYRLDNCLVGADDRIHAVVDWEMATLGDTRTDLALMLVYDQLSASAGGDIVSDVAKAQGYPGNDQQLARYAEASGRDRHDLARK